jgi:hypothetical protein
MAQGPYTHVSQATNLPSLSFPPSGTIQIMAADTPNLSAQREVLYIRTQASALLLNHPQGLELAVLLRVRDLLDTQIRVMQSP